MAKINQNYLKDILSYDPETGVFTWIVSPTNSIQVNSQAGTLHDSGYIKISIGNKCYRAHRLAWLYVHGEWPAKFIDHINGNRSDNRLCNLRQATPGENKHNQTAPINNTSGFKGVTWHKQQKKWNVKMKINKKRINIGSFDDLEFAGLVASEARSKLHGEFARD